MRYINFTINKAANPAYSGVPKSGKLIASGTKTTSTLQRKGFYQSF
jgi:hypothetical protein